MFPDFIGIGAQRSGTTWLNRNLQSHPEIWLSPIKELHYFDGKKMGIPKGVLRKFFSQQWPHKRYRKLLLSRLKAKTHSCRLQDWVWDYRFFLREQNDQWYSTLFEQGAGKCTGEITPAYAALDEQHVAEIHQLMPASKIIFLLRNPIDRSWSQAVKEFVKHKKRALSSITDEEWIECFTHRRVVLRSDYLRTIDTWQRFYPPEQVFVGFFDDITERPRDILIELYRFLGVEVNEKYLPPNLGERVNAGEACKIPNKWELFLSKQYYDQMKGVKDRLGGRSAGWLARADNLLKLGAHQTR